MTPLSEENRKLVERALAPDAIRLGILLNEGIVTGDALDRIIDAARCEQKGEGEGGSSGGRVPAAPDGATADAFASWIYKPTTSRSEAVEAIADVLCALETARTTINAMPHGDNCFLHSDGGEFDACRCGKDAVLRYVEVTQEQIPQYSCPAESKAGQPSEASTSALATDAHQDTPSDPQRREG